MELNSADTMSDPKYVDMSNPQVHESSNDYSETSADSDKDSNATYKAEWLKGEYAKAKLSKGLEKVSLGGNDNLYRTKEGQYWYVGKGPDGKSFKMQVQVDETTGEMTIVGKVYSDKAGSSKSYRKISIGSNDNIYITEEGQAWYVTDSYKAQIEIDVDTGEITVLDQHGDVDGK
jgi:hypothetical protein